MNRKQRRLQQKKQGKKKKGFSDVQKGDVISKLIDTGHELLSLGKVKEAQELYEQLLKQVPENSHIHYCLGAVAHKRKDYEGAYKYFETALKKNPRNHKALVAMGFTLLDLGKPEEAVEYCEKSLEIKRDIENVSLYGTVLKLLGRFEESEKMFREAIKLNPNEMLAYKDIISSRKMTKDDSIIDELQTVYDTRYDKLDETNQVRLHFALGKAYYDLKEYDHSFEHYKKGNDLKSKKYPFGKNNLPSYVEKIPESFTKNRFEALKGHGFKSKKPIFVVGMPRSGTTLTEQIIASHPMVHGAGELLAFGNCCLDPDKPEKHGLGGTKDTFINRKFIDALTGEKLTEIGEAYINYINKVSPSECEYVVDKMPFNFMRVGLIKLALPDAKIIYAKRNPMDIGLSIYRQLFQEDMGFAYDLETLGKMLITFEKVMNYWQELLGDDLYVSSYEDLVQNPEAETRKLIEYCGLPWDDSCLSHHTSKNTVKTASFAQVRAPINTKSVEGWRKFEKGLKPLADMLGIE